MKNIATACLLIAAFFPLVHGQESRHSPVRIPREIMARVDEVYQITDQAILAEIAKNDSEYRVRRAAINMINDSSVLFEITKNERERVVRERAVEKLHETAEQGDAKAQYRLSILYLQGVGVDKDIKKSVEWYKKTLKQDASLDTKETLDILQSIKDAAEQGDAEAQYILGMCNEHGSGFYVEAKRVAYHVNGGYAYGPNLTEALAWYTKSAKQGYAPAQYEVGVRYGFRQKYAEAAELFRKAAEQGYSLAQEKLASYYLHGLGVDKDELKAIEWFTKAAEQGNLSARHQLGQLQKETEQKPTKEEKEE